MKYLTFLTPFCLFVSIGSLSITTLNEDFLQEPKYYTYDETTKLLRKLEAKYPSRVKLHSIGKSVKNLDLWALEISSNVGNRSLLEPMFKYVANMHGDETIGYQILNYLVQYLVNNYDISPRIRKIIDTTDIFIMPSMNPDGYIASRVSYSHHVWKVVSSTQTWSILMLMTLLIITGRGMRSSRGEFWSTEC